VKPTRLRLLLAIFVVTAVLGWVFASVVESLVSRYLPLPWTAAVAIWVLVVGLAMWGWIVRPRLLRKPGTEPLPPYVAARTAALALSASRVGAGVAGFYAGVLVSLLDNLDIPAAHDGALTSGASALGGVAMAAVALWIERMCRIKEDDGEKRTRQTPETRGMANGTERATTHPHR
jgi:Protein of unknown function (DUF3180)